MGAASTCSPTSKRKSSASLARQRSLANAPSQNLRFPNFFPFKNYREKNQNVLQKEMEFVSLVHDELLHRHRLLAIHDVVLSGRHGFPQ